MSNRNGGEIAVAILGLVLIIAWTIFQYVVLIAAFVALSGILKVLMGILIIGSIFAFSITLFIKSLTKR